MGLDTPTTCSERSGAERSRDGLIVINLLNTFNWGAPIAGPIQGGRTTDTNFSAGTFGRVTSIAGTPRVLQFGVKYGF